MRSYIVERLNNYFGSNYSLNRVPLLIGPSGVAKSALIKEGTKKHNMRLVDIRTAFMSRLDIEGLSEKIEVNGTVYSECCPMFDFIKCTDEYIRVAQECVNIIDEELKNCKDEFKADLQDTREKFAEQAKVPVLIFDEITRAEPSVRQVLTKILTDKEFMNLSMKKARVVAATNSQLGSNGEVIDIYSVNEAYDVAFYDRFESMYVSPKDMNKTWLNWAKSNLDSKIYNCACKFPYDEKHFENTDVTEAMVTPYACYRTWEMASNFVKSSYASTISPQEKDGFIDTLIGEHQTKLSMDTFLDIAVNSNTPALIISPSGMGKTSRVRKIVKNNNYEMISINLSEVDRLDVEGMPVKSLTLKAMIGKAKVTRNVVSKIKSVIDASSLPRYCTIRAPKKEYVDKFQKALSTGNKVVIYFDECNRVQNVSVMSAIFQVISDNKLFGIEFEPKNVTTVLSCNLSDNCADAQDLDPALCARFAIWREKNYSEQACQQYKNYVRKAGFNSVVASYLLNLDNKKLLEVLSSVESRTMEVSAASSRAWEDLSRTLDTGTIPFMTKAVIFNSDVLKKEISDVMHDKSTPDRLISVITQKIGNWAASDCTDDEIITVKDKEYACNQFYDMLVKSDVVSMSVKQKKDYINNVYALDIEIQDWRENFFKGFLGKYANDFLEYFNKVVGMSQIITDLQDGMNSKEIAEVTRNVISENDDDHRCKAIAQLMESVNDVSLSDKCRALRVMWRELGTYIDKRELIDRLSTSTRGEKVLVMYEEKNFYKRIQKEVGMQSVKEWQNVFL